MSFGIRDLFFAFGYLTAKLFVLAQQSLIFTNAVVLGWAGWSADDYPLLNLVASRGEPLSHSSTIQ